MLAEIPSDALRRTLLRDADLCVKCGLCLGHCPTYTLTRDEAESPRGRIALMHGLAGGMLAPSPKLEAHLDGCLTCRACEVVCPADVPYGELIDAARNLMAQQRPARTRTAKLMAAVLDHRPLRYLAAAALMSYQRSGLQWLVRASRVLVPLGLSRLESLLPKIHWPRLPSPDPSPRPLPVSGEREKIALFANCTSPLTEPAALEAAMSVLRALGCEVAVPATQGCCGALAQHAGLHADASACATKNIAAFGEAKTVVGIASGCTAQLLEYGALAGEAGKAFGGKVRDIHGYVAGHPALATLSFKPLKARVALHTPCTMKNVVKGDAAVVKLLEKIPGLEIVRLDSACCGAAGSYFITQPLMADALAKTKVDAVAQVQPLYLLSSNVGCAMHLAAALRRDGLTVPVRHPLELLAESLAPPQAGSASRRAAAAAARPVRPA